MTLTGYKRYLFRGLCMVALASGVLLAIDVFQADTLPIIPPVPTPYFLILLLPLSAGLWLFVEKHSRLVRYLGWLALSGSLVSLAYQTIYLLSVPFNWRDYLTSGIVHMVLLILSTVFIWTKKLQNPINFWGNSSVVICGFSCGALIVITGENAFSTLITDWQFYAIYLTPLALGNALMLFTHEYGKQRPGIIPHWKPNILGMTAAVSSIFIWQLLIHASRPVLSAAFMVITTLFIITLITMGRFSQTARFRAQRILAAQKEEARMLRELRHSRDEILERSRQLEHNNRELAREIKRRWHAEKRLQESEQRLQALVNTAGEGIITIDEHGLVEDVNQVALQMFCYEIIEIVAEPVAKIIPAIKQSDSNIDFASFVNETMQKYKGRRELHGRKKSGELFPMDISLSALELNDRISYTAILRDITERKTADQRLRTYTAQLARTNQELKEFANVASHDLQEPLRKIRAFSDRIEQLGISDERALDFLKRIQTAAEHMQHLIYDWIHFSRITTNPMPFTIVDLNQVAMEVLTGFEEQLQGQSNKIEVCGLQKIEADPHQIHQLLHNVIHNAVKFRDVQKPLHISITGKQLNSTTNGSQAMPVVFFEMSIQDNGIGFDEKYNQKIFMLFQRLHGRNRYTGTGVGLAICQKIVERHGGYIRAKSQPGKGTEIIVTIPLKQSDRHSGLADFPGEMMKLD